MTPQTRPERRRPRLRPGTGLVVACLVLVPLLVVGAGRLVASSASEPGASGSMGDAHAAGMHTTGGPDSECQPGTPSGAELGYVRAMVGHHQQAVTMGRILRADESVPYRVRNFADQIAIVQRNEITDMRAWLAAWDEALADSDCAPGTHGEDHEMSGPMDEQMDHDMPGMLTEAQLDDLAGRRGGDAARQFVSLMIEHHRGAVEMSTQVLEAGDNSWVQSLASHVVGEQRREIGAMQRMLASL